jgi:hypothetical protein
MLVQLAITAGKTYSCHAGLSAVRTMSNAP